MSPTITFTDVGMRTPEGRRLFEDLNFSLSREKVGLVGRNGAGKTSLMRAILGELKPSEGTISRQASVRLLPQIPAEAHITIADALDVAGELSRIAAIEAGDLDAASDHVDWAVESRIEAAFHQVGLSGLSMSSLTAMLSGGQRTRLALADLLIHPPDILLLDEPTNNLDREGRASISQFLRDWPGGALVASHDRQLLEQMDKIVELSSVDITVVTGGWSEFEAIRDASQHRAEAELQSSIADVRKAKSEQKKAEERKARRDKKGRTSRKSGDYDKLFLNAQQERAEATDNKLSRIGVRAVHDATQKLDAARDKVAQLTPINMNIPSSNLPASKQVLSFDDVAMDFGKGRIFAPASFSIRGPERVVVAGANGAGKTTLMKILLGQTKPTSGKVSGPHTHTVALDQHARMLDSQASILTNIERLIPALTKNQAYAALARFGFRNRDAQQIVGTLSGGERLRAALACIFSDTTVPGLLLLDEPTNHLDLHTIEILESTLNEYDGALLIASHDQSFLNAIGVQRELQLGASGFKDFPRP